MQIFNVGSIAATGAIEFEPGLKQRSAGAVAARLIPPSRGYAHERTWRMEEMGQQRAWALQGEESPGGAYSEFPQLGVKPPSLFLGAMSGIDPMRAN